MFNAMKHLKLKPRSQQRGITLIESLVALVVLALGVLGLIGFQLQTLRDTRDSVGRSRAIVSVQDIAERMRANPNATAANYTSGFAAVAAPNPNCTTAACSVVELAAFDVWRWKANVAAALPGGQAAITPSATDARQFAVMVGWLENQADANATTSAGASDATARTITKSTAIGGTTVLACPAGLTCHFVYVQPFR
jgi:type IV pilus assembly protein PilV